MQCSHRFGLWNKINKNKASWLVHGAGNRFLSINKHTNIEFELTYYVIKVYLKSQALERTLADQGGSCFSGFALDFRANWRTNLSE